MLFARKKKKLLSAVYLPIRQEYESIRESTPTQYDDQEFQFAEYIKLSEYHAYHHPAWAYMNQQLNLLAQKWDDTLYKNRVNKLNKLLAPYPPLHPRHSFLLVPSKRAASASAVHYDKYMPPDHRLIAISIRDISYQSLACIYHEMGHFIGFRNRQDRLFQYFIPILVDTILTLIFEMTCRSYIRETPVSSKDILTYSRYSEDKEYNSDVRAYARQVIGILQAIRSDLQQCILDAYAAESERFFHELTKSKNSESKQLGISVKMGFFASIRIPMVRCIESVLTSSDNQQRWKQVAEKLIASIPTTAIKHNCSLTHAIQEQLCASINTIASETKETFSLHSLPSWYLECEQFMEEPAADVFMLKMTGASCKEYIDLVVRQLQNVIGSYSVDRMRIAINKPVIHQRVLSIAMALHAQHSDFIGSENQEIEISGVPDPDAIHQQNAAKEQLWSMYQCALNLSSQHSHSNNDFFDPTRYLFKYVDELWHDNRYNVFCNENEDLLSTILYCARDTSQWVKNHEAWEKLSSK